MEKCYEYFNCTKTDCPMYGRKDVNCWEIEETLCSHPALELIRKRIGIKIEACEKCIYFQSSMESKQ